MCKTINLKITSYKEQIAMQVLKMQKLQFF